MSDIDTPQFADDAQVKPVSDQPTFAPDAPTKPIPSSALESAGRGALQGATFNFADELKAFDAATASPEGQSAAPLTNAYKYFTGDKDVEKIYNDTLEKERAADEAAKKAHPYAYGAGELAGTIPSMAILPEAGFAARALPTASKIAKFGRTAADAAVTGGEYGALSGAGEGTDLNSRGVNAVVQGAEGVVGGAVAPVVGETLGAAYNRFGKPVVNTIRGWKDPEGEASRRLVQALRTDQELIGSGKAQGMTAADWVAAHAAGEPVTLADLGSTTTQALLRSAANTSPEGRAVLEKVINDRFLGQSDRVASDVRGLVSGGANANKTADQLVAEYDQARVPAYIRAYRDGDRQIMTPEMERLMGSPMVVEAMRRAAISGKDRAVTQGLGAFNPGVTIENGVVKFNKGPTGVPTYPNLQFWDASKRELDDMASSAYRAGEKGKGSVATDLTRSLIKELDNEVPTYGAARGVASQFFGESNALEAGRKLAGKQFDPATIRTVMAKMNPQERELFQEGYASDWANRVIGNIRDTRDITKAMFNSPNERARAQAVFGPAGVAKIQARMTLETIMDGARQAMGNSTTARQLIEAGLAGGVVGGLGGGYEGWHHGGIWGALGGAGAGAVAAKHAGNFIAKGASKLVGYVDANTARNVAELLTSNDPAKLTKGLAIVGKNQKVADGLKSVANRLALSGQNSVQPRLRVTPLLQNAQGPGTANADETPQPHAKGGKVQPIPENKQSLEAQQEQLIEGDRHAQLFPNGKGELKLPKGLYRAKMDNGDVFHYNPKHTNVKKLKAASKAGKENEVLGLGPITKDEAVARTMKGEHPVSVVERDRKGNEVRAAAGTHVTAPQQLAHMAKNKSVDNTLAIENPIHTLLKRRAAGGGVQDDDNPSLDDLVGSAQDRLNAQDNDTTATDFNQRFQEPAKPTNLHGTDLINSYMDRDKPEEPGLLTKANDAAKRFTNYDRQMTEDVLNLPKKAYEHWNDIKKGAKNLAGLDDEPRYQLWPERMIRSGASLAHDVMTGETPTNAVDPVSGEVHTNPEVIERTQDMAGMAGGAGLTTGLGEEGASALGSGPFLRPALKYEGKIYKAPIKDPNNPLGFGAEHGDAIPPSLYPEFERQAMSGEDISNFQFGFMNHKGQFLPREAALDYGIDQGLLSPHDAKYGTLTSTMLEDSSHGAPLSALEYQIQLKPIKSPELKGYNSVDAYNIVNGDNNLGQVLVDRSDPKRPLIMDIRAEGGPNALGNQAVRSIQQQLKQYYPNVKFEGYRSTGANPGRLSALEKSWNVKGHENENWYHGSARTDRLTENGKIDPKRATSGPMPFFSNDPEMASSYATGKKGDTSLIKNDPGDSVANYFTVPPKEMGYRGKFPYTVEQTWNHLPAEKRAEILDKYHRISYEDRDTSDGPYTLHNEPYSGLSGKDHYDYILKREAGGNPLKALRIIWHDGGSLIGNESDLADIYRLSGYPYKISESSAPWTEARGVMPAKIKMDNPLNTENKDEILNKIVPQLEEMLKNDRTRLKPHDAADMWDKDARWTPKDWIKQLKEDATKGENGYTWTSIPDKITSALKRMGYDGIIDTGGKMGGDSHKVAIPFTPEQVRSPFAKFDPKNTGKNGLLLSDTSEPAAAIAGLKSNPFYSAVEKTIESAPQQKMHGEQWANWLKNQNGVKSDELQYTGIDNWLREQKGPVTKQQVSDFIDKNKVQVNDVVKSNAKTWNELTPAQKDRVAEDFQDVYPASHTPSNPDWGAVQDWYEQYKSDGRYNLGSGEGGTKYHGHQLPDGKNYKEHLITLPDKSKQIGADMRGKMANDLRAKYGDNFSDKWTDAEKQAYWNTSKDNTYYKSSHWDEPNVVAHMRTNEREVQGGYPDNEPKLSHHIEEIQSDWHQQGRDKGYQNHKHAEEAKAVMAEMKNYRLGSPEYEKLSTKLDTLENNPNGVPNAPFKKSWPELAMKRAIRTAIDEGKSRVSWTPGEAQAARYDLSKHLDRIEYEPNVDDEGKPTGKYDIYAKDKNGKKVFDEEEVNIDRIEQIAGKEIAQKIENNEGSKNKSEYQSPYRNWHALTNLDLKVGGEGMKGFYDKILPSIVQKLGKEYGVKVKEGFTKSADKELMDDDLEGLEAETPEQQAIIDANTKLHQKDQKVHYFDIPPKMREDVLKKGFPLFSDTTLAGPLNQSNNNTNKIERPIQKVEAGKEVQRAKGGRVVYFRINHNPTPKQKESGIYKKDYIHIHGLEIAIENAKGSKRKGISADGTKWTSDTPAHYGYFRRGPLGKDGDKLDVYVGPHTASKKVFVINQVNPDTKAFDETKTFINFGTVKQVINTYAKAFSDGKGLARIGSVVAIDIKHLHRWLDSGNTRLPFNG